MPRLLLLFALGLVAAVTPRAQESVPDSVRADSLRAEPLPYGLGRTYGEIVTETIAIQLASPLRFDLYASGDPTLGIRGLVVDETLTPSGRLFYEAFFLLWTPPPGAEAATLEISERPLPGNGTAIVITADAEVIVQTRLPRRAEEVEDLAGQAVQYIRTRLGGGG